MSVMFQFFLLLFFFSFSQIIADENSFKKYEVKKLDIYSTNHHGKNGFRNPYPRPERPLLQSALWIIKRIFRGEVKEKIHPATFYGISKENLKQPVNSYEFYWIGHSTVLIMGPKYNFITDPQFSRRASPVSFAGPERYIPPAISIEDLPPVHFVLLSHNHYDHMDEESLKKIYSRYKPLIFVPLKLGKQLEKWKIKRYRELDWWEYVEIDGIVFFSTPARHFSARSLWDRNETLWAGWYVKDTQHRMEFYFAGDTGYGPFFQEIRRYIGKPKVALIPIGAFLPRWYMEEVHVGPVEAFQAFLDLEADYMMAIHWGTFFLGDEPMDLPPKLLRETYDEWKKTNENVTKTIFIPAAGENLSVRIR